MTGANWRILNENEHNDGMVVATRTTMGDDARNATRRETTIRDMSGRILEKSVDEDVDNGRWDERTLTTYGPDGKPTTRKTRKGTRNVHVIETETLLADGSVGERSTATKPYLSAAFERVTTRPNGERIVEVSDEAEGERSWSETEKYDAAGRLTERTAEYVGAATFTTKFENGAPVGTTVTTKGGTESAKSAAGVAEAERATLYGGGSDAGGATVVEKFEGGRVVERTVVAGNVTTTEKYAPDGTRTEMTCEFADPLERSFMREEFAVDGSVAKGTHEIYSVNYPA